jgi:hypothetical protein
LVRFLYGTKNHLFIGKTLVHIVKRSTKENTYGNEEA